MIETLVTLQRPSHEEISHLNRSEKYDLLKSNFDKRKQDIEAWIKSEELDTEVSEISQHFALNVLCIVCTTHFAKCLEQHDAVIRVFQVPAFAVK